jgi:hypothetical protein
VEHIAAAGSRGQQVIPANFNISGFHTVVLFNLSKELSHLLSKTGACAVRAGWRTLPRSVTRSNDRRIFGKSVRE